MTKSLEKHPRHSKSWQQRLEQRDRTLHVHLLGIGGAGLSAIAKVLLDMGVKVSGSDRQSNPHVDRLRADGATIVIGQEAANLTGPDALHPDVVLISSAIGEENPERQAAEALQIPVVKRNRFLPVLLAGQTVIAVAGTHGKSTTTAMIVKMLREGGIDAGYIIGAELPEFGNAAAGGGQFFVIEADEYDRMFLGLKPTVAVITNVEWDHPDCYPTPASFKRAFIQFADSVAENGFIVSCADDPGAAELYTYHLGRGPRWLTYGVDSAGDLVATNVTSHAAGGISADLVWWNAPAGALSLAVPGVHNVLNAMAALLVAHWCGIPRERATVSLQNFQGTARRFELKGEVSGVTVIDDYAHHPTEIAATLAAARHRFPDRRIWAIFQPHTFSRTQRMLYRMGDSFGKADQVIVTAIYAAREQNDGTVSAAELVAASEHPHMQHIAALDDVARYLGQAVQAGDVVVTLGAGDGYRVGEMLLAQLKEQTQQTE